MTAIQWDKTGERFGETGVDHGVLYKPDVDGVYGEGVAWNGLTTVTESPSGAEATAQYADNIKYLNLVSAEQFAGSIEAFTYPVEFEECEGAVTSAGGVLITQQARKSFGLSWRTLIVNDTEGQDAGEKIHLVYGALATPSEKAHATVNDSPELTALSWDFTTTGVEVPGLKPSAHLILDSRVVDATAFADLKAILYGDESTDPRLPLPAEVIDLFEGTTTSVNLATAANQPTYNAGTHVVTLPAVTGVQWKVNGVNKAAGAQPALTVGQTANVVAVAQSGYRVTGDEDWSFDY